MKKFLKSLRSPLKWAISSFLQKCWTTCRQKVHFSSTEMCLKATRLDPSCSMEADENSGWLWLSHYDLSEQSPEDTERYPGWSQLLLKSRASPLSQQRNTFHIYLCGLSFSIIPGFHREKLSSSLECLKQEAHSSTGSNEVRPPPAGLQGVLKLCPPLTR